MIDPIEVVWNNAGLPDLLNLPNGTPYSSDVRSKLTGAGAGAAVISVIDVTGSSAFTIENDDDLENPADTNANGTIRLRATYNSVNYDSVPITWSVVTVASPDVIAPTAPLIETLLAISPTEVNLTILPPMDVKTPSSDADGLSQVLIERQINSGGYTQIAAKSVASGLAPQLVKSDIGTVSGSSAIQTASNWEIAGDTDDLWGTSDSLVFAHAAVSGDFIAHVLVKEFVGVIGTFSKGGIMARATVAANSAWVATLSMCDPSDGANDYVKPEYRPSAGSSAQSIAAKTGGLSGDRYLVLTRSGDLFSQYYIQGDVDPIFLGSASIALGASCEVGLATSSQSPGNSVTLNFENFTVNNIGLITHSDTTGIAAGDVIDYHCRATDLA